MIEEKKIDDGGPAFPFEQGRCPDGTWNQTTEFGMSLRDWFAGMAFAGILASQFNERIKDVSSKNPEIVRAFMKSWVDIAYILSGDMLEARKK